MELNNKILSFQTQPKNPSKWNSSGFPFILEDVCDFQIKYQKLQQKEVTKTQQDPSFGKQKTSVQRASNRPRTPFEKPFFFFEFDDFQVLSRKLLSSISVRCS